MDQRRLGAAVRSPRVWHRLLLYLGGILISDRQHVGGAKRLVDEPPTARNNFMFVVVEELR